MDKEIRNGIERATQRARKLLRDDFAFQLNGTFDVLLDGSISPTAGSHLSPRQTVQREKIVAAIEHKRAVGMNAADAVADYLRDAAFTTLNRFVALKMLEARELVQECITKGEQSAGYREFCGMAPGVALLPESAGYRLFIESLFDELSTEVKVLFDRRDSASILWPRRATFEALLEVLNVTELSGVWGDDETIGWVYQFFNSGDERKKMREKSQAPRTSRELAVRNQFFTPRYVVEFLVDNTLGRTWLEMHGDSSNLKERCCYLVQSAEGQTPSRPRKDPRDLRILDPACGSGHFLLYCFDLLLTIYEEAWTIDVSCITSQATGRSLRDDYPDIDSMRQAIPALILEHNLHGVDIDPRASQIAALALWLRAQRAWKEFRVSAAERSHIQRTHIVVAEPMPGDAALVDEFASRLDPPLLRDLFCKMVSEMRLAGELGPLILVEKGLAAEVRKAREQFVKRRQNPGFLPGMEPLQKQGKLDFSGIDEDSFFHEAEANILDALRRFAEAAAGVANVRRRLFTDDAVHGIALIDLLRMRFDVVLMNPPFGEATDRATEFLSSHYADWNKNILCAFISRAKQLLTAEGLCGAVVDRTINEKSTYEKFRRRFLLGDESTLNLVADLGWDVLDANVEVSAFIYGKININKEFYGIDAREEVDKPAALQKAESFISMSINGARKLPNSVIGYFFPQYVISLFETLPSLSEAGFNFFEGHTLKSERYFRLVWECPEQERELWKPLFNGTAYSRFAYPHHDAVLMGMTSGVFADSGSVFRNLAKHEQPAICFGKRGEFLDAQMLPAGFISTVEGKACLAPSNEDAWCLLAFMNSRLFQAIVNLYTGQHKYSGYVEVVPYAGTNKLKPAAAIARDIVDTKWLLWSQVEVSPNFSGLKSASPEDLSTQFAESLSLISDMEARLNQAVIEAYDLVGNDETSNHIVRSCAKEPILTDKFRSSELQHNAALYVQYAIGCAFGRFSVERVGLIDDSRPPLSLFTTTNRNAKLDILVDDPGMENDICERTIIALGDLISQIVPALAVSNIREYIASYAFNFHSSYYSRSGRFAPIYWQLATPSASYSVWLYIHAFNKDTLFRLQNDLIAPKLAHEERKLERMSNDLQEKPTADNRKAFVAQESFVEEIREFLEKLKPLASLWSPNLYDGVIINFALLWQLVSQNKPLQKKLKDQWDELITGKYDWTHLSMHLWPERVVPKCAKDRSLAISHGLEEVFWVEGDKRKWEARPTLHRPIEELVRERSSPAIKAALKNLLDAPNKLNSRASTRSRGAR